MAQYVQSRFTAEGLPPPTTQSIQNMTNWMKDDAGWQPVNIDKFFRESNIGTIDSAIKGKVNGNVWTLLKNQYNTDGDSGLFDNGSVYSASDAFTTATTATATALNSSQPNDHPFKKNLPHKCPNLEGIQVGNRLKFRCLAVVEQTTFYRQCKHYRPTDDSFYCGIHSSCNRTGFRYGKNQQGTYGLYDDQERFYNLRCNPNIQEDDPDIYMKSQGVIDVVKIVENIMKTSLGGGDMQSKTKEIADMVMEYVKQERKRMQESTNESVLIQLRQSLPKIKSGGSTVLEKLTKMLLHEMRNDQDANATSFMASDGDVQNNTMKDDDDD